MLFHQSGGCCDGSSPMCYPRGDFIVGDRDVLLGKIGGRRSTSARASTRSGSTPTSIIDVVPGRGGMFSLDNGREKRFLTRSVVCAVPKNRKGLKNFRLAVGIERTASFLRL